VILQTWPSNSSTASGHDSMYDRPSLERPPPRWAKRIYPNVILFSLVYRKARHPPRTCHRSFAIRPGGGWLPTGRAARCQSITGPPRLYTGSSGKKLVPLMPKCRGVALTCMTGSDSCS